ncbi:MAG: hypothetical protein HYW86_04300 [Candidatus Roizmanbacteria bacterium]|nr:MAG: hypothetical protein HYW86_04300 [Candidatus Roizmanbacteria bacterium]
MEISKSGENLGLQSSPLERKIAMATRFLGQMADFTSAGITEEQVIAAAENAKARIRREYEEEARKDALLRVQEALFNSAQTPEERAVAGRSAEVMETQRVNWRNQIEEAKKRLGPDADFNQLVKNVVERNLRPTFTSDGGVLFYAMVDAVWKDGLPTLRPSEEYRERVLKALGVLDEDQPIDSLVNLPKEGKPQFFSQGNRTGIAKHLPNFIEDTTISVFIDRTYPRIDLLANLSALSKIVNFHPEPKIPHIEEAK